MSAFDRFARLLGLPVTQAEDALTSEPVARLVVSRRLFLGAAGVVGAGSLLPPGEATAALLNGRVSRSAACQFSTLHLVNQHGHILRRWYPGELIDRIEIFNPAPEMLYARLVRVSMPSIPIRRVAIAACNPEWLEMGTASPYKPSFNLPGVIYQFARSERIYA